MLEAPNENSSALPVRPSLSLLTEIAPLAADAIIPVEPRYLETVGLLSVINNINEIREGWRHPHPRMSGILVIRTDNHIKDAYPTAGRVETT